MKTYAVFYQRGVISGDLIEACGDRSVIRIDGRICRHSMDDIAREECSKRHFLAYRLFRGRNILDCVPLGEIVEL